MAEPKNVQAIRKWVKANRPDLQPQLDALVRTDAAILLMSIGFESGRQFQSENPTMPINQPHLYA
jgi:hypothetical protein